MGRSAGQSLALSAHMLKDTEPPKAHDTLECECVR